MKPIFKLGAPELTRHSLEFIHSASENTIWTDAFPIPKIPDLIPPDLSLHPIKSYFDLKPL